ncbi:MAG: arginine N-succinyltransferase [Oceanospirillaceae bacterium]|nr:arginine N-succinyltransferase [Oceanospirillaceae bacterium]
MLVLRPVRFTDLPAIEHLAVTAGNRLTTLPNNRDHLAELINNTEKSLRQSKNTPTAQSYHFVLEDSDSLEIHGISGIEANVGSNGPFYSFRCDSLEHQSAELQIENTIDTLTLCRDNEGASRLCTFFLASDELPDYALKLLSLSRLMFIGQQPLRFNEKLILELQGVINEHHQSPFWQALGQHFFNMDFHRANYLTGINAKGFIADLMPRHPVYVPLLEKSAQQSMGLVRPDMQKVASLLESQGFSQCGYISIFDGGPTLEADTAQVATIQQQYSQTLVIDDRGQTSTHSEFLVSNNALQDYRCIHAQLNASDVYLNESQATQLNLTAGDTMYLLALTPRT